MRYQTEFIDKFKSRNIPKLREYYENIRNT
jgi:hypothetical protein